MASISSGLAVHEFSLYTVWQPASRNQRIDRDFWYDFSAEPAVQFGRQLHGLVQQGGRDRLSVGDRNGEPTGPMNSMIASVISSHEGSALLESVSSTEAVLVD
jgi:hypothetical protein